MQEFRAEEALAILEPAVVEFADLDDDAVRGELMASLARVRNFSGDPRRALELLETALELLEKSDAVQPLARGLVTKANVLGSLGRRREALALAKGAVEIAATERLTSVHLRAMVTLSGHLTEVDVAEALAVIREMLVLSRRSGHRDSVLSAVGNIGYLGFLGGEWDGATAEMDASLAEELAPRDRLTILNNSLIIRAARGEDIAAGLAEMARLGSDSGMSGGQWQMFIADPQANAAMAGGDLSTAGEQFAMVGATDPSQSSEYFYRAARAALWSRDSAGADRLLAQSEAAGGFGPIVAARHACLRAGLAALEGRSAEAISTYRQALKGWRSANAKWDEALTGLDMAILLDPALPEVAAEAQTARAILVELRAKPYLERLDTALARASAPATKRERAAEPVAEREPAA
jgi:tetratricopeptide (TPR) repeat protein